MYISIDSYYPVNFYNECLATLQNNGIAYSQAFYVRNKVFEYTINVPYAPIMVNYDLILPENEKYIINHVIPLDVNEIAIYQRRLQDTRTNIRKELYLNDALISIENTNYGVFFNLKNSEEAISLTKNLPVRLYYMGKYLNRYKVFFCNSIYIESFLNTSNILLKKDKMESIVQFEQKFNYNVLERRDRLIKYSKTAYFENGIFNKPQYQTNKRFYII